MVSSSSSLEERTVRGLHHALLSRLPRLPGYTPVLDVGCGTGAWMSRLHAAGFTSLWGVDVDTSRFAGPGTAAKGDLNAEDLQLQGGPFGLITAIEVVEHLENPGRLFFHVARNLAPDGWLLLTTPNIQSVAARLRFLVTGRMPAFDHKSDPTHITPILLPALKKVLATHGLMIESNWGYPDTGSLVFRKPLYVASRVLGTVLGEETPGDILCMLVRRTGR